MNAVKSRETINNNMDAMSVTYDALDGLIETRKNISVCINRAVKIINKGKGANQYLEVNTKHAA